MKTDVTRRALIKRTLAAAGAVGAAWLLPPAVMAAWPRAAFDAKDAEAALAALSGSATTVSSSDIELKAPPIAENGAVVGVSVSTRLPDVDAIHILVPKNASPLVASFEIGPGVLPMVATRIKIAETTPVVAVVRSGGRLFRASREVKVTTPGCGGAG